MVDFAWQKAIFMGAGLVFLCFSRRKKISETKKKNYRVKHACVERVDDQKTRTKTFSYCQQTGRKFKTVHNVQQYKAISLNSTHVFACGRMRKFVKEENEGKKNQFMGFWA